MLFLNRNPITITSFLNFPYDTSLNIRFIGLLVIIIEHTFDKMEVAIMSNLEELTEYIEEEDEDGTLVPLFLAILEVCFCSNEHGL